VIELEPHECEEMRDVACASPTAKEACFVEQKVVTTGTKSGCDVRVPGHMAELHKQVVWTCLGRREALKEQVTTVEGCAGTD
jgi:hypothetical protein